MVEVAEDIKLIEVDFCTQLSPYDPINANILVTVFLIIGY